MGEGEVGDRTGRGAAVGRDQRVSFVDWRTGLIWYPGRSLEGVAQRQRWWIVIIAVSQERMKAGNAGHLESRHMGWDSNKIWHLNHNMQREDM